MKRDYSALAAIAETAGLEPAGQPLRGEAAADLGRRMIYEASGADDPRAAARVAVGRPPVGEGGPSPVVRARVNQRTKQRLARIAAQRGSRESDLVREAIDLYLETAGT
ncbi:MAG: hypothetical protein LBL01_04670 [Bifidobacteriaceae bacterium]|nr:hypothetical protein [Bifidobacteriaceae bacterium]